MKGRGENKTKTTQIKFKAKELPEYIHGYMRYLKFASKFTSLGSALTAKVLAIVRTTAAEKLNVWCVQGNTDLGIAQKDEKRCANSPDWKVWQLTSQDF